MFYPYLNVKDEPDCPSPDLLSIISCKDIMFAAAFGKGVYCKNRQGKWVHAEEGLPDGVIINRLQELEGSIYACTNMGMFYFDQDQWHLSEMKEPCYQVKKQGLFHAVATEHGLWCKLGTHWEQTAYPGRAVYDLFLSPQYYIIGTEKGISVYDRYTGTWAEFVLGVAVINLVVCKGRLLGVSKDGHIIMGDRKGGFQIVSFDDLIVYSLKSTMSEGYACTNRGLYLLDFMKEQIVLKSIVTGYPVTDMVVIGNRICLAALNRGLKSITLS